MPPQAALRIALALSLCWAAGGAYAAQERLEVSEPRLDCASPAGPCTVALKVRGEWSGRQEPETSVRVSCEAYGPLGSTLGREATYALVRRGVLATDVEIALEGVGSPRLQSVSCRAYLP